MVKQISKPNSKKGKNLKNIAKNIKKKQVVKSNFKSKNIANKSKAKKPTKAKVTSKSKKTIVVRRSSGREEKFDTDKLTQTVSRSGVSFPVAKDLSKSITKKIKKSAQAKSTGKSTTKKKKLFNNKQKNKK
ncbi:MAG: hypothetical protein ACE5SW_12465 [Nitrososphaeraceae archaeon]